ncbi:MAG: hypothetical protein ACRDF5_03565 [bacterium]
MDRLLTIVLAPAPQSESELQNTFYVLIALVVAVGIFLWLLLARFSRPP